MPPDRLYFLCKWKVVSFREENGYAIIDRKWQKGDVISFEYNMPITKIAARPEVRSDIDRIALQRVRLFIVSKVLITKKEFGI